MKKTKRTQISWIVEIVAILVIIGLGFTACGGDDDTGGTGGSGGNGGGDSYTFDPSLGSENIGKKGPAGGIIIYYNALGFTVTGAGSFTANYLEAAPTVQVLIIGWSSTYVNVTGATGTAIGTGKANTAAIIAAHSSDTASNNAAKAAVVYTGGGKSDWFLPSKDELNEMYKARTHLDFSSGYYWSSSQYNNIGAWYQNFASGSQGAFAIGVNDLCVRAVRAF